MAKGIVFWCESCGAPLDFGNRNYAYCPACGNRNERKIEYTPVPTVSSILQRITILLDEENFDEASISYKRILEIDPYFSEAYWKLALCELKCKTEDEFIASPKKIKDVNNNFNHAIDFATEEEKEHYKTVLQECYTYCTTSRNQKNAKRIILDNKDSRLTGKIKLLNNCNKNTLDNIIFFLNYVIPLMLIFATTILFVLLDVFDSLGSFLFFLFFCFMMSFVVFIINRFPVTDLIYSVYDLLVQYLQKNNKMPKDTIKKYEAKISRYISETDDINIEIKEFEVSEKNLSILLSKFE